MGIVNINDEDAPWYALLYYLRNKYHLFKRHMKTLRLSRLKGRDASNARRREKWLALPQEKRDEKLAKRKERRQENRDAVNSRRRALYAESEERRARISQSNKAYKAKIKGEVK